MSYAWNWTALCSTGLAPWLPTNDSAAAEPQTRHLAPCFEKVAIQTPLLFLLAIGSAYQLGVGHSGRAQQWRRDVVQQWTLRVRLVAVGLLALVPVIRYLYVRDAERVDTFIDVLEMLTFLIHFMSIRQMCTSGSASHRGPLKLIVYWTVLYILAGSALYNLNWHTVGPIIFTAVFILHTCYALSLVPSGTAEAVRRANTDADDDELLLEAQRPTTAAAVDRPLGKAIDDASWLQLLTFGWVTPLIRKGLQPDALRTVDDLFDLPACLHIAPLAERMQLALSRSPRMLWALHRAHGFEFYWIGVYRLTADAAGFAGPMLLGALLSHKSPPAVRGTNDDDTLPFDPMPYWYAFGLFSSTLLSVLSYTYFEWRLHLLIARMQVSIVSAIYSKALEARNLDEAKPEIVNLMSTDANRIANASYAFHALWSVPVQIAVTLYLLYTQIGLAFVAGIVFVAALLPINQVVVNKMKEYETLMLEQRDKRMAICSEVLGAAKTVKLMAWERMFMGRIGVIRVKEIALLRSNMNLNALVTYLWSATPMLMCLLTFGTSVLTGHELTAATTFTSVALLNMLIAPLNLVPWCLNGLTNSWVSLRRVQELLDLPNIDLLTYYSPVSTAPADAPSAPPVVLQLRNANFNFEQQRNRDGVDATDAADIVDFQLSDCNLTVRRRELVCLKGVLGSGKSSLLNAILAKMQLLPANGGADGDGTIALADIAAGFGYVAQTAWLQRGTVRDNIVWGARFDESRYKSVLFACALTEDLAVLGGDLTGVGESGQTLSGGQRARVALARAVYQDKDVYLLDDVLAALDAHVAKHIVRHCVFGLLATKTRIVVSEHTAVVAYADQVFELSAGTVRPVLDRVPEPVTLPNYLLGAREECAAVMGTYELRQDAEKVRETGDTVLEEEAQESGTVSAGVLGMYLRACGFWASGLVLLMLLTERASASATDLWLAHWVTQRTQVNRTGSWLFLADPVDPSNWWNLEVYAGLALGSSVATLIGAFVFAYVTVRAARLIHERMLRSVFATHFQFFDVTPLGRLLNRFSSDTAYADQWLPFSLSYLMSQVSSLVACLAVTVAALPWIAILLGPLTPVYLSLQSRYRSASREIRRLASNAMSPLYAHFTETLQGLTTVRAMRAAPRFRAEFMAKMERSMRADVTGAAAESWLAIRLQVMGAMLVGGCGLVSAATAQHASNPGLVGLAISYALTVTSLLEGVMFAVAQSEQQFIAVERIKEYCELEAEDGYEEDKDDGDDDVAEVVGAEWPEKGVVHFDKVRLQYRANLTPALLDVELRTNAGERLGVAGRTGAGKSSLLAAIFRVTRLSAGRVSVDGVDVATVPVRLLRARLSLVPQQAFLFAGTVRENVDVEEQQADAEIWRVLERCHAAELVRGLGGLEGRLEKGGGNVSAGQKQLLCLARALLRGSRLVCIDEGTANLDMKAEREVQQVLREAFEGATVLLIAHRMTSLVEADRVAVMRAGQVMELGAVRELIEDEGSLFAAMLREQSADVQQGTVEEESGTELLVNGVTDGDEKVESLVDV